MPMTVKEMGKRRKLLAFLILCYNNRMVEPHMETAMIPSPQTLVGTWRRFGSVGPVYEIIGLGKELPDHDRMMRVRVIETGEEVDYRFTDILDDPRER